MLCSSMTCFAWRQVINGQSNGGDYGDSMASIRVLGVIPARYASSRFDGKALADICGKPMIQHVYERASQACSYDQIVVATDDERIERVVLAFGGDVVMTPRDCPTGTERVGIVAKQIEHDIVANIQGDEPLLAPEMLDTLVRPFLEEPDVLVSTLQQRIDVQQDYFDPNVVKVITDQHGFALYFSRASIPGNKTLGWNTEFPYYRHVGLYAYTRETLMRFLTLEPTPLEKIEGLEQLRFLENGISIRVMETDHRCIGVDTPADLERVIGIIKQNVS